MNMKIIESFNEKDWDKIAQMAFQGDYKKMFLEVMFYTDNVSNNYSKFSKDFNNYMTSIDYE